MTAKDAPAETPEAGKITERQMRQMHALLRDHGITGDKAVHDYLSIHLGRDVESRTEVTATEAAGVIAHLETVPPAHSHLAEALMAFQKQMPTVQKTNTARVPTKDGGHYSYTYADLTDVSAAAIPLLNKHGLTFTSRPRLTPSGGYELVGILRHVSGEYDEGALPLFGRDAQQIGGSITYARRYLLGCMTGIVTDDDDDNAWTRTQARVEQAPPPPAPHSPPEPDPSRFPALAADAAARNLTAELLGELDTIATNQGRDLAWITAKFREAHGHLPPERLPDVAPEPLAALVDQWQAHLAQQNPA